MVVVSKGTRCEAGSGDSGPIGSKGPLFENVGVHIEQKNEGMLQAATVTRRLYPDTDGVHPD